MVDRNSEIDEFAYIITHDIAAPVRAMVGNIGMLERSLEGQLDDKQKEYLASIASGKARYLEMMTAINDFVGITRNHKPSAKPFSSGELIDKAIASVDAKKQKIGFEIEKKDAVFPLVSGDSNQIYYVFWEIIDNAIKYRNPDRQLKIQISYEANSELKEHVFCFEDNGIGIHDKFFDKIFQVFRKLHHEKDYPGMGLGLAYLKKITCMHGGKIWVESEPKIGSKFFVSVPIA